MTKECLVKPLEHLLDEEDASIAEQRFIEGITKGGRDAGGEWRARDKDGTLHWLISPTNLEELLGIWRRPD